MQGRHASKNPLKFFKFQPSNGQGHPTHNRQVEGSSPSRPTIFSLDSSAYVIFMLGPTDYKSDGLRVLPTAPIIYFLRIQTLMEILMVGPIEQ